MHPYVRFALDKQGEMLKGLQEMVECESPTDSPRDVNRFLELLVERSRDIARPTLIAAGDSGQNLLLEFAIGAPATAGTILGLGHADTVWPIGTLKDMPFREGAGKLYGPGVLDMKAGLLLFLYAVRALQESDTQVNRRIVLLVVSDEETGSKNSRAYTENAARDSVCVLVLEPGEGPTGKLKTARKGVGNYSLTVEGRSSHAGVDFANGASAIVEAARQIGEIATWTDLDKGVTVNPGIISGGTRRNVVAAQARIDYDVRAVRTDDLAAIDQKFRSLEPVDRACHLRVEGGISRPPMERTEKTAGLFARARRMAAQIGFTLEECLSGGGSDGNFTAALGVPTLDGIGAVGEGAHAANESVFIDRLPDRTALIAALLAGI